VSCRAFHSVCDLIKFPYFADTTERGDRVGGGERRRKDKVTLRITLISAKFFVSSSVVF